MVVTFRLSRRTHRNLKMMQTNKILNPKTTSPGIRNIRGVRGPTQIRALELQRELDQVTFISSLFLLIIIALV